MKDNFTLLYDGWEPAEQKLREAMCTLGNGYMATRGAGEESKNDSYNYPGTYLAGGYNRAKTKISGKTIENEDFVNFPNWLCLSFRPDGGEWLDLQAYSVLYYRQTLNMKSGILIREFRVEDTQGRRTSIKSRRVVSMRDKHMAALQWSFTPENWNGKVEFDSALDGTVINDNVARYRDLESRHLTPLETEVLGKDAISLLVQTRQSKIYMAQAARTRIFNGEMLIEPHTDTYQHKGCIGQRIAIKVSEGETYTLEKVVGIYTSRDRAISEPGIEAKKAIERAGRFEEIVDRHQKAFENLWHSADIKITNGDGNQLLLRLHIFHVLQSVSTNIIGMDVGVTSRGLHGEAYRGHIFWDELYIFPFLNLRFPDLSRSLLMYRYYRLEEARFAAREAGKKGAMYPWQSGSSGREESQVMHRNPKSGNWIPDNTHLQRHINAAIAYNIWNYYLTTNDQQFLSFFGAEMFLSIAQFWASMTTFNSERKRYEIHGVVGPDEYHTSYPDSDQLGLDNNAYTNVMVAWVMMKAVEIADLLTESRKKELLAQLEITADDFALWSDISKKMYVPFIDENVISQFEGYEKLEEFPWESYQEKYGDIHRLDRILESEGKSPNTYKASKQADVLMLFYLFSRDQIFEVLEHLGYPFSEEKIQKNITYYSNRTSHGSTLSRLVFSWILIRYDKEKSWENFETVLKSDFEDIQGGTTPEGIHLGAMAGSLDLVQRGYLGLEVGESALWINPPILDPLKKIALRVQYRGHWIAVVLDDKKLTVAFEEGCSNSVTIGVTDKTYQFEQGEVRDFLLE
nr:glycoside hydrolase family 65 protein [Cytophagales bacterium]